MYAICRTCNMEQTQENLKFCEFCSLPLLTAEEEETILAVVLEKSKLMPVNTLPVAFDDKKFEVIGLVFGTSSKQAFWGVSTQADRLSRAYVAALANLKYEAALIKADAVVGVTFALNNSTGSGNKLVTGSSEAVMLLGTAIKYNK